MDGCFYKFSLGIWKERNEVVFDDIPFFVDRVKLSFISSLYSWVGLLANGDFSLVTTLLCILLGAVFRVVGFFSDPFFCA